MRYLKILLTGWCVLAYLQSACLPVDLILSGLRLTEERHVCRCKLTGVHDDGCRCPCCAEEIAAVEERAGTHSCCPDEKGDADADSRLLPMVCGCGARADFAVTAPRLLLYLSEEVIGLQILASVRRPADRLVSHLYSISPDLPDKIPI
ncbi:MAG: hypothetical protein HOC74_20545 [Gemmatimonadetes bacterium]|jgi:hypothetical protein|nr:hypothetical protein [Gemmatimonadota bacterium]